MPYKRIGARIYVLKDGEWVLKYDHKDDVQKAKRQLRALRASEFKEE